MKLKPIPSDTAVHTPTEEEAKELLEILHENGYEWCGGTSLIEDSEWEAYQEWTCYYISSYVEIGNIYEHNDDKTNPITIEDFKRIYCEEEKPQPKFKKDDCVSIRWINKWGRITDVHFSEEAEEWEYNIKVYPKGLSTALESNLAPYTEPESKDETMEAKELNLVELLKGHKTEYFYSPLYGRMSYTSERDGLLYFESLQGEVITLFPNGHSQFTVEGYCGIFPSRVLYEQYPLDAAKAWSVWQSEQKKPFICIHWGEVDCNGDEEDDYTGNTYFRTPADRDKCLSEIKAIIEKYSK